MAELQQGWIFTLPAATFFIFVITHMVDATCVLNRAGRGHLCLLAFWLLVKKNYYRATEQVATPPSGSTEAAAYWCMCLCSDCWFSTRRIEMSFFLIFNFFCFRAWSLSLPYIFKLSTVKTKNKGNVFLSHERCQNISVHCHSSVTCNLIY